MVETSKNKSTEGIPVLQDIKHFETGKGFRLGIPSEEIKIMLGKPTSKKREHGRLILKYIMKDESTEFLKYYAMPEYFGVYTFEKNRLVKMHFGFEIP